MTDRPILFSAPMVRGLSREAKAPGTGKSQTRRLIKPRKRPSLFEPGVWSDEYVLDPGNADWRKRDVGYETGMRLWVRETWTYINDQSEHGLEVCIGYNADGDDLPNRPILAVGPEWRDRVDRWPWIRRKRPAIHMPRWASRLTLTVTDVRVQRLQEISERDAEAEGVYPILVPPDGGSCPHVEGFRELWDKLNGKGAWDANPWVSALTFTVEHRNIDADAGART